MTTSAIARLIEERKAQLVMLGVSRQERDHDEGVRLIALERSEAPSFNLRASQNAIAQSLQGISTL